MLIDEVSDKATAIILWLANQGYSYNAIACDLDLNNIHPPVTGKVIHNNEPITWSVSLVKQVVKKHLGRKPKRKVRYSAMTIEREMLSRKLRMNQTYRQIAEALNNDGKHNSYYEPWTNEAVKKTIYRYVKHCNDYNVDPFVEYPASTVQLT